MDLSPEFHETLPHLLEGLLQDTGCGGAAWRPCWTSCKPEPGRSPACGFPALESPDSCCLLSGCWKQFFLNPEILRLMTLFVGSSSVLGEDDISYILQETAKHNFSELSTATLRALSSFLLQVQSKGALSNTASAMAVQTLLETLSGRTFHPAPSGFGMSGRGGGVLLPHPRLSWSRGKEPGSPVLGSGRAGSDSPRPGGCLCCACGSQEIKTGCSLLPRPSLILPEGGSPWDKSSVPAWPGSEVSEGPTFWARGPRGGAGMASGDTSPAVWPSCLQPEEMQPTRSSSCG
ncbi:uncharacterized protein ACOB8E_001979 [Sarcophilus harrisii]